MNALLDRNLCPDLETVAQYIGNPVFMQFCAQMKERYQCTEKIEFSSCSLEKGWNVKFKKSGKTLCTIYPREGYFTVMVVIGPKEKGSVEAILSGCNAELQEVYYQTKEGNGQKWLMLDLEDMGQMYEDIFRLIDIRKG